MTKKALVIIVSIRKAVFGLENVRPYWRGPTVNVLVLDEPRSSERCLCSSLYRLR